MSYGLNIEMHKQVSYHFFISILNDSNTVHFRKEIVCFAVLFCTFFVAICILQDRVLERMLFFQVWFPIFFAYYPHFNNLRM